MQTDNTDISIEFQLLINCCTGKDIALSTATNLNQERFLKLVKQHRVVNQVTNCFKKYEAAFPELYTQLKQLNSKATRKMLNLSSVLIQINSLFSNGGIETLAFKGPTLSSVAYGNVNARFCRDLDVLIDELNITKAEELLLQSGFTRSYPEFDLSQRQHTYFVANYDQMVFVRRNPFTVVELHWKLFQNKHLLNIDFHQLYKTRQVASIGQSDCPTLSAPNLFLYVITHGAKHNWNKLYWLLDFSKLASNKSLNWDDVYDLASNHNLLPVVHQAVLLSNKLLEIEFPSRVLKNAVNDKKAQQLTQIALNQIETDFKSEQNGIRKTLDSLRYRIQLKSNLKYQLGYFRFVSLNDFSLLKLPDQLFFLYYPLRPVLWTWRLIFSR